MNPSTQTKELPDFCQRVDLLSPRLGAEVLYANDEFFAPKENLIQQEAPVFIADKYTDHGKWMDGWESRRRREPGHDWCLLRMGMPGQLFGVNIDTAFFTGNHPPFASLEAVRTASDTDVETLKSLSWETILEKSPLAPGSSNFFPIRNDKSWTHLKLNIFPDGGVARLRAYGRATPELPAPGTTYDLVSVLMGGIALECSNMFYSPMNNLLLPGSSTFMGDGWETKRKREPGFDWVILELGAAGIAEKIEVETHHFKGNYPDRVSIEAAFSNLRMPEHPSKTLDWFEILPPSKLRAHDTHLFTEFRQKKPITHLKVNIHPDGGLSRVRVFGKRTP